MSKDELQQLAAYFSQVEERIAALHDELKEKAGDYPRLHQEGTFATMLTSLREAVEQAAQLEDYISHATDENWRVERE